MMWLISGLGVTFLLVWLLSRSWMGPLVWGGGRKVPHYDERQTLLRGRASSYALMAVFIWGFLLFLALAVGKLALSPYLILDSLLFVGLVVHNSYAYWQGVFLGVKDHRKVRDVGLAVFLSTVCFAYVTWDVLRELAFDWELFLQDKQVLSFFFFLYGLILGLVMVVKYYRDRREMEV